MRYVQSKVTNQQSHRQNWSLILNANVYALLCIWIKIKLILHFISNDLLDEQYNSHPLYLNNKKMYKWQFFNKMRCESLFCLFIEDNQQSLIMTKCTCILELSTIKYIHREIHKCVFLPIQKFLYEYESPIWISLKIEITLNM